MNREYNKPLIDRNMKTCSETYQFEKDLKWEVDDGQSEI